MKRDTQKLTLILLAIYLFVVIWIILFKMSLPSEISSLDHLREINLIPFHNRTVFAFDRYEVFNNIAIFIPFGLYLMMMKIDSKKVILYGLGFSLLLEIMQYVLAVGISDITDLIDNTIGAIIGVLLYSILSWIFKKEEKLNHRLNIITLICTIAFLALTAFILFENR